MNYTEVSSRWGEGLVEFDDRRGMEKALAERAIRLDGRQGGYSIGRVVA